MSKYYFKPMIQEDYAYHAQYFEPVLEDLELLDNDPLFHKTERTKNADTLINKYISWGENTHTPMYDEQLKILKRIFNESSNWIKETEQFSNLTSDIKEENLDASWVEEILNYDHWSFFTHSQIKDSFTKIPELSGLGRIGLMSDLPMPNYKELSFWVITYAINEHKNGNSLKGLKGLRQLAELFHSSGTLVGNMYAAKVLKDYEYFFVKEFGVTDWSLKDINKINAYQRVSYAWNGILSLTLFNEIPNEFEEFVKPENGICAAAWSNPLGISAYRDFFYYHIIFEENYKSNFDYSNEIRSKLFSICHMDGFEVFLVDPPVSFGFPYLRRLLGMAFISAEFSNWMHMYDDL